MQGVVLALMAHITMSQPAQFTLDQRQQPVERRPIAIAPGSKQLGNFLGMRFRHNSVHSLTTHFLKQHCLKIVAAQPAADQFLRKLFT